MFAVEFMSYIEIMYLKYCLLNALKMYFPAKAEDVRADSGLPETVWAWARAGFS